MFGTGYGTYTDADRGDIVRYSNATDPLTWQPGNYFCAGVKKVVARFRQWETEEKSYGLHPQIKITFDIDPVNMM